MFYYLLNIELKVISAVVTDISCENDDIDIEERKRGRGRGRGRSSRSKKGKNGLWKNLGGAAGSFLTSALSSNGASNEEA